MSMSFEVLNSSTTAEIGVVRESESETTMLLHRGDAGWEALCAQARNGRWEPVPSCFSLDPDIAVRLDAAAGLHVEGEVVG